MSVRFRSCFTEQRREAALIGSVLINSQNPVKALQPFVPVMCDAHSRGDVAAIRELLEKYPALEKMGPDDNHLPWLHWAAEHGQISGVEFWLRRGWDVNLGQGGNSRTDRIYTALHAAKDAATFNEEGVRNSVGNQIGSSSQLVPCAFVFRWISYANRSTIHLGDYDGFADFRSRGPRERRLVGDGST